MENKNVRIQNSSRYIHYLAAIVGAVVLIFLDQFTKHLVLDRLKGRPPFIIWEGVFQLEYLENRGAAFGLFQNQRLFFFACVFIINIAILWFYHRAPMEQRYLPLRLCAVFIMAGAWGNCIDRITLNYVVDFLYFKLIDFPIFNVADIYVTVATFALALFICFYYKEDELERILRH